MLDRASPTAGVLPGPGISLPVVNPPDEVAILGIRLAEAATHEEGLAIRESEAKDASAQIYLNSAWLDAVDEADGLRDMIAATPATSLAGAAVQIAEALTRCDRIRNNEDPHPKDWRAVTRLLFSALDVVADAAGATDPRLVELISRNAHMNPWVPVERRLAALAEAEV